MKIFHRSAVGVICSLMLGYGMAETPTRPRVALVVGNAKYEASVGPLRNPVSDAKSVSKALRDLGFAVIEEHNVTRDQLLVAMGKFRVKLPRAEVALFYYAGHGIAVGGSNYLIPLKSGYTPDATDDLTLRMLAETKLVNAEQVLAEMSAAGTACNLVILDACRSTPLARDFRSRDLATPGGLMEMKPPAGSLIAFATDAGHTAQDGSGANGLYTGELLKHLKTPDLTIEQVFKRTRAGVMGNSDGGQIPAEYSRLVGEDIYLAGRSVPVPTPVSTAAPHGVEVVPAPSAIPVVPPSAGEILKLANAGKSEACIEGLRFTASNRGPGTYAVKPLESLLEFAKEELKNLASASPRVEAVMKICDDVLAFIPEALPSDQTASRALIAKAQNRRGDCLMILGRAGEALLAYNIAIPLVQEDAYPIFNRGRAQLALGQVEDARADFIEASSAKYNQPKARKLALAALSELP
jgi:Caspase domain